MGTSPKNDTPDEMPGNMNMKECPVCHMDLPLYDPAPGKLIECGTCFADLEVSEDSARLIFRKFGGKAFGQL